MILGPNFLPGIGAPQIFSALGLAVPKTTTGKFTFLKPLWFRSGESYEKLVALGLLKNV